MMTILGGTGYIGQAFAAELKRRGWPFVTLARREVDYTRYEQLVAYLQASKPSFLINAAGYTGKPNVDACELAKADTLQGNTMFPAVIAHACAMLNIPWGHVSSGCIYSGAKVRGVTGWGTEKDLTKPELRQRFAASPSDFQGFTEADAPNFNFRDLPCSFYSGTKALGEEAIAGVGSNYIWRLRIPFDEFDNPRNYLSKIQRYSKVYDNVNSLSHRADFARACLDLWALRAPFGIYNVTNPGPVTTRQVVQLIERQLKPAQAFEYWENDEEFYRVAAKTPRSNCILDTSKLLAAGVKMRPVSEALEDSLRNWRREA